MSTKMHNYRVAKEQWWPFAKACRAYYMEHHPIAKLLREISEAGGTYKKKIDTVNTIVAAEWTVDLQIFDEGDTYLIRPLENGYFFMNNFDQDQWAEFALERVSYDNRTDVPPEDEKNAAVADWVDEKILGGEYLIFTVLNRDNFVSICFDELVAEDAKGAP